MPTSHKSLEPGGLVSQALHTLVSKVPPSAEPAGPDPRLRARALARSAAIRAAALSGTMSLPPGPFGLLTVLPDLLAVWRLQQQLVADIAATFSQSALLTPEAMVVCLFKHGDPTLTADLVTRSGNRLLIRRVASSTLHQLLAKIAIRVTRRLAAKGFSRWLPLIGALGVGAYAFYETSQVAANAIELFSGEGAADSPPAQSATKKKFRERATRRPRPAGKTKLPRRRRPGSPAT